MLANSATRPHIRLRCMSCAGLSDAARTTRAPSPMCSHTDVTTTIFLQRDLPCLSQVSSGSDVPGQVALLEPRIQSSRSSGEL